MDAMLWLFGEGQELSSWQMAARGVAMFFVLLVLIRVSGRRSFGQGNAFDAALTVMLGAILSRAVIGVSPFWPTVCAGAAVAVLHRLVALASVRWAAFDRLVSGRNRELLRDGRPDRSALRKGLITDCDLTDAVRQKTGREEWAGVHRAVLERDGSITVVPKQEPK
jgi:uncharacterized membrane protein YcaP (DUF421 family)